jgi:hypothetical protein
MPPKQQRPLVKDEPQQQRPRVDGGLESDAASAAALLPCAQQPQGVGALQAAQYLIEAEMRAKDAEIARLQAEVARLHSENARLRLQPVPIGHHDLHQLQERLEGMEQRITCALQQQLLDHAANLHAKPACSSGSGGAAARPRPRAAAAPPAAAPPTPVPAAVAVAAAAAAAADSISSSVLLGRVADKSKAQQFAALLGTRLAGHSYRLLYAWSRSRGGCSAASFHEHCDGQVGLLRVACWCACCMCVTCACTGLQAGNDGAAQGPTLVLVRSDKGHTFGGYASESWSSRGTYVLHALPRCIL